MSDSDQKSQPTTISLVPTTVTFAVLTVITVVAAFLILFYNANGNAF
jgi:hypothetical protein